MSTDETPLPGAVETAMPPKASMGPLDSVIILILACMLALLILWAGSQLRGIPQFSKLPDWLTQAASSGWSYATGGASSILLAALRARSNAPTPNYLLWVGSTTVIILLIVFGVAVALPTPPPPARPQTALLQFSLKSETLDHPNISFFQKNPLYKQAHTIAAEPNGHYQEYVDFPDETKRFYARAVRVVSSSEAASNPLSPVTELCFNKNPKPPSNDAPLEAHLACSEGKHCSVAVDDPGWAQDCPADSNWNTRIRLIPMAYADTTKAPPGWKVPSLETLRNMRDRERVGYTEFTIQSTQLGGLKEADSLQYAITVNGSPLHVDGWAPEDMLKPFSAGRDFTFSFGLENLNFSGANDGCENIQVVLTFRAQNRKVKQETLLRRYAALRDADQEEVRSEDGTAFTWGGKYVKPKAEDRIELFVLSTLHLEEAKSAKSRIDAAKLAYDGMDVVGVLRPPLNNPNYGIVVGLRQASGQVRFTFDVDSARKIRNWVASLQAQKRDVFRKDMFLYQMRPGDAGTGALKSCSGTAAQN